MKIFFLTAILLISFIIANAQFIKGDKVLGGTLSFTSQDQPGQDGSTTNTYKTFSVTPSIQFLLNENFAIGGQLGYSSSDLENSNSSIYFYERNSKSFSLGIIGQRYFKVSDKFLFSIIGQFNFARGYENVASFDYSSSEIVENKTQNYSLTTSISPNFIFFPSPNWGFNASIGSISHLFGRNLTTDEKGNYFSINYGGVSFGVSYYFRKSTAK